MLRKYLSPLMLAAFVAAFSPLSKAADADFMKCADRTPPTERLKCYDDEAERLRQIPSDAHLGQASAPEQPKMDNPAEAEPSAAAQRTYLSRVWNLDGRSRNDDLAHIGRLRPHRQSYFIVRTTSRLNEFPSSPVPGHQALVPQLQEFAEAKFQFSFKSEIAEKTDLNWREFDSLRIWAAYTQQSNWQAFNIHNSAAFRETNYEPEIIFSLGNKTRETGLKLLNLGLVHQSNGQSLPLSRSWNRVYLQGGWEWDGKFALLARGWWRIPEATVGDDNPDIENFMGRGDLLARWQPSERQSISLLIRNNLRSQGNRGFMQLDWATPFTLGKAGKTHVQLSTGYGESLVDYNFRQTTFGIGVSFRDW